LNVGQPKNLNAYLVAVFEEPASADRLLALYIRQVFWAYPLRRLYSQLPQSVEVKPYIDLLLRTGFQGEGILAGHIEAGNAKAMDAIALGMLREEFDSWCAINEPRLSLV
jgi:hypothetical protein